MPLETDYNISMLGLTRARRALRTRRCEGVGLAARWDSAGEQ